MGHRYTDHIIADRGAVLALQHRACVLTCAYRHVRGHDMNIGWARATRSWKALLEAVISKCRLVYTRAMHMTSAIVKSGRPSWAELMSPEQLGLGLRGASGTVAVTQPTIYSREHTLRETRVANNQNALTRLEVRASGTAVPSLCRATDGDRMPSLIHCSVAPAR